MPTICPIVLNQESDLVSSGDHFPKKNSINFGNNSNISNLQDEEQEGINSIPQPMNLIQQNSAEQVSQHFFIMY
jgi:hypothetical protein